ncbi:unnamed protein product [Closterium sp. NIES-54]
MPPFCLPAFSSLPSPLHRTLIMLQTPQRKQSLRLHSRGNQQPQAARKLGPAGQQAEWHNSRLHRQPHCTHQLVRPFSLQPPFTVHPSFRLPLSAKHWGHTRLLLSSSLLFPSSPPLLLPSSPLILSPLLRFVSSPCHLFPSFSLLPSTSIHPPVFRILNANRLAGTIPAAITTLTNLEYLSVLPPRSSPYPSVILNCRGGDSVFSPGTSAAAAAAATAATTAASTGSAAAVDLTATVSEATQESTPHTLPLLLFKESPCCLATCHGCGDQLLVQDC